MRWKDLPKILFPAKCIACGNYGSRLCIKCKNRLIHIDFPMCLICENLSIDGKTHEICKRNYNNKTVDKFLCLYAYDRTAKRIINRAKSGNQAYRYLEVLIDNNFIKNELRNNPDYLVPIPATSKSRLVDQSKYISRNIAAQLNIKILPLLRINKNLRNKQQKELRRESRFQNIINKYITDSKLIPLIEGKSILLIDDICTTGATLMACAETLKRHGAREVCAYALLKDLKRFG